MCMPSLLRLVLRPCESGLMRQVSFYKGSFLDERSCFRVSKHGSVSVGMPFFRKPFDKLCPYAPLNDPASFQLV
jgi:hypothetical protein